MFPYGSWYFFWVEISSVDFTAKSLLTLELLEVGNQ